MSAFSSLNWWNNSIFYLVELWVITTTDFDVTDFTGNVSS